MAEPLTATTAATGTVTGVAFLSFFAGLPADVVLGAFAGAIIFVVFASEYGVRSRIVLAIGSFSAGLIAYKPVAAIIIDKLPGVYDRGADAAGALIAAACAVPFLMMINNSGSFLRKKGGSNDNRNDQ
ncbi:MULTISPECIES: putative holin [unclassified Serratia (in: enterobacteria)]|uniref:putative holin n=1 Tax=unclassified Serratia (in: enterobacteria) TaxID=2647522 RepID=UPI00307669CE